MGVFYENLPDRPGVYLMKDKSGRVIYVGKAVSLKNRVRSYFQPGANLSARVSQMRDQVAAVDYVVTDSETEALILECNLIKRYKPKYNVRFVDDKQYPYIRISMEQEFPRVSIVRSMKKDGARYFGPFTRSGAVHETLKFARTLFPFRTCSDYRLRSSKRACLYYHIERCMAPCVNNVSPDEYRKVIEDLCEFLNGKHGTLIKRLAEEMEEAAEKLEFEKAARLRDRLRALQEITEKQKIVSHRMEDEDVIGCGVKDNYACIAVFFVRSGKIVEVKYFFLSGTLGMSRSAVISEFIKQYYFGAGFIPPRLLVQDEVEDKQVLESWLSTIRQDNKSGVQIVCPARGSKRELVRLAGQNAEAAIADKANDLWLNEMSQVEKGLRELQEALRLECPPNRIECFDVSNIRGVAAVASMAVMINGKPEPSEYRRFRLNATPTQDDYAMMREVLERRFKRLLREQSEGEEIDSTHDQSFGSVPDLVIVDGGRGHLATAVSFFQEMQLEIPVAALAKEQETLFVPWQAAPLGLARDSKGLLLLMRLRDEAHRFAVSYHRNLRSKGYLKSVLDDVPGIGKARKRSLLNKFGSLDGIINASVEELASAPGMTLKVARELKQHLSGGKAKDGEGVHNEADSSGGHRTVSK